MSPYIHAHREREREIERLRERNRERVRKKERLIHSFIFCEMIHLYFVERSIYIYVLWNDPFIFMFCGTINLYVVERSIYILWNDPFLYFVERSIFLSLRSIFIFYGTIPFLYYVERYIFIFCGMIHFCILWNTIILLPMFSGTVEESTLDASGSTSLRNINDGYMDHVGNWNGDSRKKHYSLKIPFSWD
jgi:hypothetical protein